jgi:hypothetical protein
MAGFFMRGRMGGMHILDAICQWVLLMGLLAIPWLTFKLVSSDKPRTWRFSLRALLVAMTVIAVMLGAAVCAVRK